jgi:hypothetical protein
MITTFILNIIYFFVYGITLLFSGLGEVTTNNDITNGIVALKSYYMSLNAFLPLGVLVAIVAFDLAFEAVVFAYKGIRWAYQKVPMVN